MTEKEKIDVLEKAGIKTVKWYSRLLKDVYGALYLSIELLFFILAIIGSAILPYSLFWSIVITVIVIAVLSSIVKWSYYEIKFSIKYRRK